MVTGALTPGGAGAWKWAAVEPATRPLNSRWKSNVLVASSYVPVIVPVPVLLLAGTSCAPLNLALIVNMSASAPFTQTAHRTNAGGSRFMELLYLPIFVGDVSWFPVRLFLYVVLVFL